MICLNLVHYGYYIEVLHVIYQKKLEKILYKLKLTVTLLFLREKYITLFKKEENMKWPLVMGIFGQFLGMIKFIKHVFQKVHPFFSVGLLQAKVALFKGYCATDQQMICCNII
jgi:hypothetical protein